MSALQRRLLTSGISRPSSTHIFLLRAPAEPGVAMDSEAQRTARRGRSHHDRHGGGIERRFNVRASRSARSIAVRNGEVGTGFRRYATAPARQAYSSASLSSCAVMKMTGGLVPLATSERYSSKPVMSPRCTSITRHAEPWESPESSTSRPEAKVSAVKPANSTRRRSARHTDTSSSTIDTSVSCAEQGCIARENSNGLLDRKLDLGHMSRVATTLAHDVLLR